MNINSAVKQSKKMTNSEKWAEVLNRPAIQEIPSDIQMLVDAVAQIGYAHARSGDAYTKDLLEEISYWSAGPHSTEVKDQLKRDQESHYTHEIIRYYNQWTFAYDQKKRKIQLNMTDFSPKYIYSGDRTDPVPVTPVSRKSELGNMSRIIPLSYAVYTTLFLSLSLVFGITFYYGLRGAGFIVGPWTHLMLFVGAVGLTATAVATGIEWVKLQNGRKK